MLFYITVFKILIIIYFIILYNSWKYRGLETGVGEICN